MFNLNLIIQIVFRKKYKWKHKTNKGVLGLEYLFTID